MNQIYYFDTKQNQKKKTNKPWNKKKNALYIYFFFQLILSKSFVKEKNLVEQFN